MDPESRGAESFDGPVITRFAPSPTGLLHLGHAYAACLARDLARRAGGKFLLRIEDIDAGRCRPEFEQRIFDDLHWLGLEWEEPVRRQSEQLTFYQSRLAGLAARRLTYPCFCTRQEILAEVRGIASAPQGPDGPIYPGTCRELDNQTRESRLHSGQPFAIRLNIAACLAAIGGTPLAFCELGYGPGGEHGTIAVDPARCGDIVLGRKDLGVSYHLAVVLDDHLQGVTLVTRGEDLHASTHVQRLIQAVLGLAVPDYRHHPLVRDPRGRRVAKRDHDLSIAALRAAGSTPDAVRDMAHAAVSGRARRPG